VLVCGAAIATVAWVSTLSLAILLVGVVGAGAGAAYVTGFTLLQESVADELRGRTFATLYTLVRVSLLMSLTLAPIVAGRLDDLSNRLTDGEVAIGSAHLGLQGVRLALFAGGAMAFLSGLAARRRMRRSTSVTAEP
jgi:dTMP kinase